MFEQTKTGLSRWFLAIYLVTSSKGGISAMELQALDGLRQLPDRLELAAQDQAGDGAAGAGAAERAGRGRRDLPSAARGLAAPGRGAGGKTWSPARSRAAAAKPAGAAWGGSGWPWCPDASAQQLRGLPRPRTSPSRRPVATDGWSGYAGLAAAGYAHEPLNLSASWGDAALRLPAIHLVFGLAKRWLLGTHHGAV